MKNVYESFFGLSRKPFSLLPHTRFLFPSRTHRMALTLLEYGISDPSGCVVLTGESGTGKTMLLRHLGEIAGDDVAIGTVHNTHAASGELMRWILVAFELDGQETEPTAQHRRLVDHLQQSYAQGRRAILVIDEAQNLDQSALDQLRLLTNINSDVECLLQLVVVGQPGLRRTLQQHEMRSFVQRISVDYQLQPFNREETLGYIRHRLEAAGGSPDIFGDDACMAVHYFAHGVPRLINSLCNLALVLSYAEERRQVDMRIVVEGALARLPGGLSGLAPMPREMREADIRSRILGED